MNATSGIVLAGLIVGMGRWAEDKEVDSKIIVGVAFVTLALSVMSEYNKKLGDQFAALIVVTAILRYGIPIVQKLGLVKR